LVLIPTQLATTAQSGDWGGIEFKNDIDQAEGRFSFEREGIFLDYVNHADIRYGGGQVSLDSQTRVIAPLQMTKDSSDYYIQYYFVECGCSDVSRS
jgi:hypothetical protein